MNSQVLVTGASGFIGSHLVRGLVRAGHRVHAVSRNAQPPSDVTWWPLDLADGEAVERLVTRLAPDVVFHLASEVAGARDPKLVLPTFYANQASVVHLLSAAERLPATRVVLAGSIEEPSPGDIPSSPYAAAKVAATGYARLFHDLWQVAVTTLRLAMVYGPAQADHSKLVPYVITSLLRGEVPMLGSGVRQIDWVYIDDVVDAFMAAAASPGAPGQVLDIGSGTKVSIQETVSLIVDLINPSTLPQFGAFLDRPRERVRIADPDAAAAVLGWQARVPLVEGLSRTVRWYAERTEG